MEKPTWKTIAIIMFILLTIETAIFVWGFFIIADEENKMNECAYNICGEYPDAYYEDEICFCYDYSILGDLQVVKTEYMK